jgi:hypothetical protein
MTAWHGLDGCWLSNLMGMRGLSDRSRTGLRLCKAFFMTKPVRLKEIKAFTGASARGVIAVRVIFVHRTLWPVAGIRSHASGFQNMMRSVGCEQGAWWLNTTAVSAARYASPEESCSAARCTRTQVVATQASLGQALAGNLMSQRLPSDINLNCAGVDTWASNG